MSPRSARCRPLAEDAIFDQFSASPSTKNPLNDAFEVRASTDDGRTSRSARTPRPPVNAAPVPVLAALGLADAAIADIVQSRVRTPYAVVPGQLVGRGLGVTSNTFRIEAEGWVTEARKARIVAVVQRRSSEKSDPLTALGLAILSWRMGNTR